MGKKLTRVTGIAAPLPRDDINTDQIAPIQPALSLRPDYKALLFSRWRRRPDGSDDPDFVLNRPQFRNAAMLVTGRNFGCGSTRDDAVAALSANGIGCVVARGFADLYRENCLRSGVLAVTLPAGEADAFIRLVERTDGAAPFTADVTAQVIRCPDGTEISFALAPAERMALLEGLDDIGLTLKHADEIAAWESRTAAALPWLQTARDRRRGLTDGRSL